MQELTFEQVGSVTGGNGETRTERVGRVGGGASLAWEAAGLVRDGVNYVRDNHERWQREHMDWALERYRELEERGDARLRAPWEQGEITSGHLITTPIPASSTASR